MTAAEARALHAAGMELASHSMSHPDLRQCSDRELRRELVESREAVEAITGVPCLTLAYPTGLHDPRVALAAANAGYQLAFTSVGGPWRRLAAPRVQAPTTGIDRLIDRLGLPDGVEISRGRPHPVASARPLRRRPQTAPAAAVIDA